jgi:DNA-binding NtrC family response regulator
VSDRLTIMIVNEDADGRFLLERQLKRTFDHCTLIACASGNEALALVRSAHIDALVTAERAADQSGVELIAHARRRAVVCPILLVTLSDDVDVERAAYHAGATKVFRSGRGDFANFLRLLLSPRMMVEADEKSVGAGVVRLSS